MKNLFFAGLTFAFVGMSEAQSLQTTAKGRELLTSIKNSLEVFYSHDMILTPTFEKGMNGFAHEQAGVPLIDTTLEENAHYHTAIHFSHELFNQIENSTIVELLTPERRKESEVKSFLATINPNRFYLEQFIIDEEVYIVLALDRFYNSTTRKFEE